MPAKCCDFYEANYLRVELGCLLGTSLSERYTTELTWDVDALGLAPGTYAAEFVIHDGDRDRAVGCVTIQITN